MNITVKDFGTLPGGEKAYEYILENGNNMRAHITNLGGCILKLFVPDKNGAQADVALSHKDFDAYIKNPGFMGAIIGRNSNRIAGGRFSIDGTAYQIERNNAGNNLHGGSKGLSLRPFSGEARVVNGNPTLFLTCVIPDMDDGFPGTAVINVTYTLTADNSLNIDFLAVCDKDTVLNLTSHGYFNLAGHDSGDIYGHLLELCADYYLPGGEDLIPTGEILKVAGTPFDFRTPRSMGDAIRESCPQMDMEAVGGGFDHNYVLSGAGYRKAATFTDPASGRRMTVFTDLPGAQLYSCPTINTALTYKDGARYKKSAGFCFETQLFPDAINMPWVTSPLYRAGRLYKTSTAFQFSV